MIFDNDWSEEFESAWTQTNSLPDRSDDENDWPDYEEEDDAIIIIDESHHLDIVKNQRLREIIRKKEGK